MKKEFCLKLFEKLFKTKLIIWMSLLQGSTKVWIYCYRLFFVCGYYKLITQVKTLHSSSSSEKTLTTLNVAMFIISNVKIISHTLYVRISVQCPCTKFYTLNCSIWLRKPFKRERYKSIILLLPAFHFILKIYFGIWPNFSRSRP